VDPRLEQAGAGVPGLRQQHVRDLVSEHVPEDFADRERLEIHRRPFPLE
jgi:hypothetical protein